MDNRNFYLELIVKIVVIIASAFGFAFYFLDKNYMFSIIFLIIIIVTTFLLIQFFNQTNLKITRFFESVKNEDFSLRFNGPTNLKSVQKLNQNLNMLNEMVQEMLLKSQLKEKYYQEIIKQVNVGIMTYNKKGHILFANPKIEELLNYKPLNNIKQLLQVDEELYKLFKTPASFNRKLIQLTNEREKKQIAIKSTNIILNQEELFLIVAQDINKELDRQEVDSWTRLIKVLTHEIMNTITPITSISQSILKYYKTENNLSEIEPLNDIKAQNTIKGLKIIEEQSISLMEFVQSYRSFFSLSNPNKILIPVQQLLKKAIVLMNQKNNTISILTDSDLPSSDFQIFADENQISQILINLIKNAIESLQNSENGIIRLKTGLTKDKAPFIEVSDNGPGILPEIMNEVFVPFFTTKKSGTGIGLSLSRHIMHLHGGHLKVNSIPNEKTSFILLF